MKRIFFTAIAVLFSLFIISCEEKIGPDDLSIYNPITFTFYSSDANKDMLFNDPVAKKINAQTGVTLDVHYPKAGDTQDVDLMIASGRFDDLIYGKGNMQKLIDSKSVIALDDWIDPDGNHVNLIEKYCPNMKKLYGDELVKLKHTDGHIYSFGTYDVKKKINETSGTMQLQHAVLKELGYPRLKNLEEYATAIRAYKKKYPEINGEKTIGYSLLYNDWYWFIEFSNPANYVIGCGDDGQWIVDRETHKAYYKFLNPEMSIFYRWLNDLNSDGTLDPESFTQNEQVFLEKIASGRLLAMSFPNWGYVSARAALISSGMPERTYAYLPITAGEKYKDISLTDYGYSGGWGISISKNCRNVIRAVKFMDYMCSEETQILVNWGIEGVNYTVQNGKRVIPQSEQFKIDNDPDYSATTGVTRWTYPFPEIGNGALDKNGDWITRDNRQNIIDAYLPVEKETLAAYGATMWTDLFPSTESLGKPVHGQMWLYQLPKEINDKVNAADEYAKEALRKCVVCKPEEFDDNWNTMVTELKRMGMEQVGEEVTAIIKQKLKLWGVE